MRTARVNSPTRERLLDAAQALMLARGFTATTVDQICKKAKFTKGSFFHYFESKDALGKQLLERFCAQAHRLHTSFCGDERDPLKRVYNYVDCAIALSKDPVMSRGCLLGTFAQELSEVHPEIRRVCAKGFTEWTEQFGKELAAAKAKHAPQASFDPRSIAEHLIAIMEGSLILGKARKDMKVVERNLRHFKAYLKMLFVR